MPDPYPDPTGIRLDPQTVADALSRAGEPWVDVPCRDAVRVIDGRAVRITEETAGDWGEYLREAAVEEETWTSTSGW